MKMKENTKKTSFNQKMKKRNEKSWQSSAFGSKDHNIWLSSWEEEEAVEAVSDFTETKSLLNVDCNLEIKATSSLEESYDRKLQIAYSAETLLCWQGHQSV